MFLWHFTPPPSRVTGPIPPLIISGHITSSHNTTHRTARSGWLLRMVLLRLLLLRRLIATYGCLLSWSSKGVRFKGCRFPAPANRIVLVFPVAFLQQPCTVLVFYSDFHVTCRFERVCSSLSCGPLLAALLYANRPLPLPLIS